MESPANSALRYSQFQHTSEVKGHGNTCDAFDQAKSCLRLTFKKVANDNDDPSRSGVKQLPYDLFPVSSFPAPTSVGNDKTIDQLVLRAGNQDGLYEGASATYVRDVFIRDKFREMGGVQPHERPMSVYVNGQYEGLYFVSERVTGHYVASNFGGDNDEYFLVRREQGTVGPVAGPDAHPDSVDEWNDFFDTAVSPHLTTSGTNLNVQPGLYSSVDSHVDLGNLIDYVLVNQLAKHSEFLGGFNWFASKRDTPASQWQFHAWDVENWSGNLKVADSLAAGQLDGDGEVVSGMRHPFYLHSLLMETASYQDQVEARLLEVLPVGGVGEPNLLSLAGVIQPVETLFAELDAAIRGEIVRYPEATETNWLEGKNDLRNNMPYQHRGQLILDYAAVLDEILVSDYQPDNRLDAEDITAFALAIRDGSTSLNTHDLDGDQDVDVRDLVELVNIYIGTFIGDSDLDGIFNSTDFVFVMSAGRYETGQEAGWQEGDWNGDGFFDSGDEVFAFQEGGYDSN